MNLQVEGDDTNAELVEDIPSGQTLAAMLQHLLRMVYKDSLTGKESEDFAIDGDSSIPTDFITIEFLLFKYLLCLAETAEIERDNFIVSFIAVSRPALKLGGLNIVPKSRSELQKENRMAKASSITNIIDLTKDQDMDIALQKDKSMHNLTLGKLYATQLQSRFFRRTSKKPLNENARPYV